ncbi:glycosyltransferase [Bifidobacterium margollesii]|uniref:glycosyltransferase n=1 Tax=Bifidobacterium margollesii TaxID=2020964 RepID=UPI001054E7D5|nr:glycosyltransferase family 4 protein [Bifidobacterium margollesii]
MFDEISVCARISTIKENDGSLLKLSGPRVDFVELPDTQGVKATLAKLPQTKRIFKKALAGEDAIIVRAPSMMTFLLYNEIKNSGLPFSIDVALSGTHMFPQSGFPFNILNKGVDRYLKKICMEANGVSYVTEHILQDDYPCRAMVEPDNPDYFTGSFSTIEMKDEHYYQQHWDPNRKPDKFVLVHAGFMDDGRKCQDYVLKAVQKVVERGFNVEMKFIGDGALRPQYEQLARDLHIDKQCTFCGLIRHKQDLFAELRKSHLFVFPTKAEGLPRAILEAMAQGLPCISSPVDGVPELLTDDYLVDWWDVDGYADKICELLSDWPRMVEQSNRNYNKALEYHNDILSQRRKEFYGKLRTLCEHRAVGK